MNPEMPIDETRTASEEKILTVRGYKFIRKLSEGGYAKVYLAEFFPPQSHAKRSETIRLACKIVDTRNAPKKFVNKFLPRELSILRRVSHPHIIPIHSIFYRNDIYYILMKYAEKGDLLEYLMKNGAIDEDQARFWMKQIALALQYLHLLEIAHRDVKCENVLITRHNNVQLGDFGFSRSVIDAEKKPILSETFCGSISYAAPEILRGRKPYNPKRADIWSLGVLLFTMLNKSNPFETKNIKQFYDDQIKRRWKFRSKYATAVSQQCKELVAHMMEPDLDRRYKIEEVIGSTWICMDPKLITLSEEEFRAYNETMMESSSRDFGSNEKDNEQRTSELIRRASFRRNSVTVFKDYTRTFDLQFSDSEDQMDKKLSTV